WILNGISLQQVLDYASTRNLRIEERPISFGELQEAKEVFVTCTTYGIAWVSELGERKFPPPHGDSLFPVLQKAFPY
ncbi:MAG: aminotransferase class IV, partial [Gemmataceae bacterium]|nr:aminotransferase class IV [Gemmataceae bacterium]